MTCFRLCKFTEVCEIFQVLSATTLSPAKVKKPLGLVLAELRFKTSCGKKPISVHNRSTRVLNRIYLNDWSILWACCSQYEQFVTFQRNFLVSTGISMSFVIDQFNKLFSLGKKTSKRLSYNFNPCLTSSPLSSWLLISSKRQLGTSRISIFVNPCVFVPPQAAFLPLTRIAPGFGCGSRFRRGCR